MREREREREREEVSNTKGSKDRERGIVCD